MSEIDDIINEIKEEEAQVPAIIPPVLPPMPVEQKTEDDLIGLALEKNDKLEEQADKIIDLFYDALEHGSDHSHSSKEQMLEALKVKLEIGKTIVEMAKIKKKGNANGVMVINTVPAIQTGINIRNVQEELDKE